MSGGVRAIRARFRLGSGLAANEGRRQGRSLSLQRLENLDVHGATCRWIFCLVRTAKTEKRQDGISFLLIEMDTPGVKVAPLVTLDGPAKTSRKSTRYFLKSESAEENLIGEENKGWTYAKYLLEFERGNPYSAGLSRHCRRCASLQIRSPQMARHWPMIRISSAKPMTLSVRLWQWKQPSCGFSPRSAPVRILARAHLASQNARHGNPAGCVRARC